MLHVGLVCPPMHGHMNPMFALGRELVRRGHRVTVLSLPDARPKADAAGLAFCPLGERGFPAGSIAARSAELGRLTGARAILFTLQMIRRENRIQLEEMPAAVRQLGIDVLAIDQTAPAGGTVADLLGIPFVTVCNALMIDHEPGIPPLMTHWQYSASWWGRARNRIGDWILTQVMRPVLRDVNAFRRRHRLASFRSRNEFASPLAIVSQAPAAFDFPRTRLKPWFHYVGPFQEAAAREPAPFPYERLDGRPLIYASLGTLQNRVHRFFHAMAVACAELPVQVVMALGGADPESLGDLPGNPVVVRYAPQLELIRRAALTITHGGMNTVMESLAHGVPLVAIPITNDQPGIAARIEWLGVGERVLPRSLTAERLKRAIERVLNEPSCREQAARLQRAIAATHGAGEASRIIERVHATRAPVLRESWIAENPNDCREPAAPCEKGASAPIEMRNAAAAGSRANPAVGSMTETE